MADSKRNNIKQESSIPFENIPLIMKEKNIVQDKYSTIKNSKTVQGVLVNTAYSPKPSSLVNQFT